MTPTETLTEGTTYRITFHPTTTGRTVTRTLTVTEAFETGAPHPVTGRRLVTYILHGPRGGKEVLTRAEMITVEPA